MSKRIKIVEINTSYGEEVCCIKCHRVNAMTYQNKDITTYYCYQCMSRIDPGNILFFYRKRRGSWVLIPPEWFAVGPTRTTIRDRKNAAKVKHLSIKSNHGKIISKAKFRKMEL